MNRLSEKLKTFLLAFGDVALMYVSLWVTLRLRYGNEYDPTLWAQHFWPFTAVFAAWLVVFTVGGLYDLRANFGRMLMASRLSGTLAVSGVIAATYFYLGYGRFFTIRPQIVLVMMLAAVWVLLLVWRVILLAIFRSRQLSRRVLFVGRNHIITELVSELKARPQLGFAPVAWVWLDGNGNATNAPPVRISLYRDVADLRAICQRHRVDLVVSGISPRHHAVLLQELIACLRLRVDFSDLSGFYERITGKVPVDAIEQIWFLENLQEGAKRPYEIVKWMADLLLSSALLLASLPLMPILYLLVKSTSPGPFLFTQVRVGQSGRQFSAMKIRTMFADAEKHGPQWATPRDARVTSVGNMLRKFRLDEIPQLINVLRGEMSLIGPRPERPEFIAELKKNIPFYEERLLVKPGLTGWAQVNFPYGASVQDAMEKLQYDLFYIKNRTLGLDLSIALRTIGTMLSRSGR